MTRVNEANGPWIHITRMPLLMDCPTHERLTRLCMEASGEDGEETLVSHVDGCAECQAELQAISDQLVDVAPSLQKLAYVVNSQALRERLDGLKLQRVSPRPHQPLQYEDLQPWIQNGETEIGSLDNYDLIRCIGRGGMGIVFEALDQDLHRRVAIKMMSPALLVDPSNSERFFREARAAAAINCPSVVSIHSVNKIRDLPYLSMEFVEGESLQQLLDRRTRLDMESAIKIAGQIAKGLHSAHCTGVIHRDVKPANVLIRAKTGEVKITDFGLAHQASDNQLTETGTLLGTPEFLAPEQIEGEPADARSDLYSLGSVLYRMCAGQSPFAAESLVATLHRVTSSNPTPLVDQNPMVPRWLSDLVGQLHARKPEDRIQSADEVVRALNQHGFHPIGQSSFRTANRRWASLLAGGLAIVALAVAIVWIKPRVASHGDRGATSRPLVAGDAIELSRLLGDHQRDVTITLVAGESYFLNPLEFNDRDVSLEAAPGRAPRLVFTDMAEQAAISCVRGQLELRGLQIESIAPNWDDFDEDYGDEPVIACESGVLRMTDCDVVGQRRGCVELINSNGEITESHLDTQFDAIVLAMTPQHTLQVRDSTLVSDIGIRFEAGSSGRLALSNAKFDNRFGIEFEDLTARKTPVSITSTRVEFACDESAVAIHGDGRLTESNDIDPATLPFRWSSGGPDAAGVSVTVFVDEPGERSLFIRAGELSLE
ncbi:MAG: serine/threonine-protein kinase [Planctomycetota bacterium]